MTIHDAARLGRSAELRHLIDEGSGVEARDEEGRTPLHHAVEAGHLAAVRTLVELGARVDTPAQPPGDDSDDPPTGPILPVVCRRGLIDRIWPLLRGQVTVRGRRGANQDGPTPLMTAAAAGHLEVVAALIDAGAEVDRRDRDGFTALAYAASFGHDGIVRTLIAAGADLNPVDHYDLCPIGLAALLGYAGAVHALAEAGADLTATREFQSFSPLHAAAQYGHAEAVRALLAAGAAPATHAYNQTPLEMAIHHGHNGVVAALATGGAAVEATDWRQLTPLFQAIAHGRSEALTILLAAGADPNRAILTPTKSQANQGFSTQALVLGASPLHLAACRGEPEFVAALLAAGADPRVTDSLGFTPLALALVSGNAEVAARLRSAAPPAADIEATLRSYSLVAAVRGGDEAAVRALLDLGADPAVVIPDTFRYHYLLRCAASDDFEPDNKRGPGTFGDAGCSVLALAIEQGHAAIAAILIGAGAPAGGTGGPDHSDSDMSKVPLIVAAREGQRDLVRALLAAGADPDAHDGSGQTPLSHAAGAGHAPIVADLLRAGAQVDINLKHGDRATALHLASTGGHADCVRLLLDAGATPRPGDLNMAAFSGQVATVRLLRRALAAQGVEPDADFLTSAINSGSVELVGGLLGEGIEPHQPDNGGIPPLMTACLRSIDMVRLLLDAGADPNAANRDGATCLLYAAHGGVPLMRLLLERGANPEGRVAGTAKVDPLLIHLASEDPQRMFGWHKDPQILTAARTSIREKIQLLLDHGANVNARDRANGRTALGFAAALGHDETLPILLEAGATLNDRDERFGRTPLHLAAAEGRTAIVQSLLEAGADPQIQDFIGQPPADVAHAARHEALALTLEAAASNRNRTRRRSPLKAFLRAIEAGDPSGVRAALEAGAEVNTRCGDGSTPLLVAVRQRSVAVVAALLAAGADPNRRDRDDDTPLMAAIEAMNWAIVQLLLDAGADPNASSRRHGGSEAQTPLMVAMNATGWAEENALSDEFDPTAVAEAPTESASASLTIVRALLAAGATVDAEDEFGLRPLWYALDTGHSEIADLLIGAGAGTDPISVIYLEARDFPRGVRTPDFRALVAEFAARNGIHAQPWTDQRPNGRTFQSLRATGVIPPGPTIGFEFTLPRAEVERLLVEQETWRRRGAFLVRTSTYQSDGNFKYDFERQTIGLLPTSDPYAVIAAACGPGTDWGWVCPAFTIRDLQGLAGDYPFRLIGVERRSLELEFSGPIVDPSNLARRLASIQTTLSAPGLSEHPDVEELAEHFATANRISFSWE